MGETLGRNNSPVPQLARSRQISVVNSQVKAQIAAIAVLGKLSELDFCVGHDWLAARYRGADRGRGTVGKDRAHLMRYVQRVLQPTEIVVHEAHLHWLIFLRAIGLSALALVFLLGDWIYHPSEPIVATTLIVIACFFALIAAESALRAWLRRVTTEFAVTDRRVIYKTGLFSRHTLEMNRSKVESVDVDQPFLGRIFGYGTIILRGTGSTFQPIYHIADPLTFRSHITAG
jgi:hypothetical protein